MKYFYITVCVRENGKSYAYVLKVSSADNLAAKMKIDNLAYANIMPTKKAAYNTAKTWNETYKHHGEYLFDFPLF